MATIILNGVSTDATPLSATALNDKLTISGGVDGYEADMLAGNDLVEIDQEGENVASTTIFGGDGDDSLAVDSSAFFDVTSDITLSGGAGSDTIEVGYGSVDLGSDTMPEGMLTLTGRINGNDGNDDIAVVRAAGAIVQGGAGDDDIDLGYYDDLDGPGSRGDTTIVDTSVNGGSGDDFIDVDYEIKATDITVNGGTGEDTIYVDGSIVGTLTIDSASSANFITSSAVNGSDDKDKIHLGWWSDGEDLSLVNTIVNGNAGPDWIKSYGPFDSTEGSIISGGAGKDTLAVADAGALTVRGGAGKDMLRVGSGQTVTGGANADTFSIEFAGGATIQDYDALTENCFCSDIIQVDGNKIVYDTYEYKQVKEKYTSASSWVGNIRVKAFENEVTCTTNVQVETGALKSNTINATAYLGYKIPSTVVPNATFGDLKTPSFPARFTTPDGAVVNNGNAPRPTNDVAGIGIGYGFVSGLITERGTTPAPAGGVQNYRDVYIPNLTVYTSTEFEKGDFSFLNQTIGENATCTVTQTLVFDDVTRATITNHWVDFGVSKNTDSKSLYDLKFGTANFRKIRTGKANLILTKGLEDNTYYPTPEEVTNNLVQKTILGENEITYNAFQTDGGNWKYTRTANATANAGVELNLSTMAFDLYTKRNSGLGNTGKTGITVKHPRVTDGDRQVGSITGVIQADLFVKYSGIRWSDATLADRLTLTVATNVIGSAQGYNTPAMNVLDSLMPAATLPAFNSISQVAGALNTRQYFSGKTASIADVRKASGNLTAKIGIIGTGNATIQTSLPTWLGRALMKGTELVPTDCTYPSTLTFNIAEGFGNSQHNLYTPASISKSNKGEFGTKYMWTSSGAKLGSEHTYQIYNYYSTAGGDFIGSSGNIYSPNSPVIPAVPYYTTYSTFTANFIPRLPSSNGCYTSSGVKEFSCNGTTRVNAQTAIFGSNGNGTLTGLIARANSKFSNNAFFSASKFTPVALAAQGMGDYAPDAEGAPFRVLFFDNDGTDKGLYVMSGSANYINGDVTAINTNPTGTSAFGGKQTIVKVNGGKGYENFSLSDINFV